MFLCPVVLWPPESLHLCQSVSRVTPDWTGKGGVIDYHWGLSQSTYKEVSAHGPVSDFIKLLIKAIMKKFRGTLLPKPLDIELTIIVY